MSEHGTWLVRVWFDARGGLSRAVVELRGNDWTIGRVAGNDVVIPRGNLSKRHQQLTVRDGELWIADQKTTNGSYVDGKRISAPTVLSTASKVYISEFIYGVESRPVPIDPADVAPPRWTGAPPWADRFV